MVATTATRLVILSPAGTGTLRRVEPAPRLSSLRGTVMGILDNRKPNFALLARELGALLMAEHGVREVIVREKNHSGVPALPATLAELARQCDFVVTGSGD